MLDSEEDIKKIISYQNLEGNYNKETVDSAEGAIISYQNLEGNYN